MHTLALRARRVRRSVASVVLAVVCPAALFASCSSQSGRPGELGAADGSVVDHYVGPEVGAEEAAVDTYVAPEAGDADSEPTCVPTGDAGVTVSTTSLMFGPNGDGLVGCGTQATPLPLTINNNGCDPFTYTATLTSGSSFYTVTPNTGPIPPGGSQVVQVVPLAIPSNPAQGVLTDGFQGTLAITTTAPNDTSHIVQLHETASGIIISSTQLGSTLDLGSVPIDLNGSAQFTVTNTGNKAASLAFALGSQSFSLDKTSAQLTPNQPTALTVTFKPTAVQPYTDTLTATVPPGTPLCASAPAPTPIKGTGTTGVGVSPATLSFGNIQCGQPAAKSQPITISNTGAAITYTVSLQLGVNSPYTLTDSGGAPLTAGVPYPLGAASSTTVNVVPKQIANPANTNQDGYADTLTVTTTGPGDTPHIIQLHQTAQGAILTLTPSSITASAQPGHAVFPTFQVGNSGNLPVSFTVAAATTQGPPNTFTINLTSGNLSPGTNDQGVVTCTAPPAGDGGGTPQELGTLTVTPSAGSILCADPPPAMPMSLN